MYTNADITIFNKKYVPETRSEKWLRTVIHGVYAYSNLNANLVNDSARRANEAVFRIPETADKYDYYADERAYALMEHPEMFWTLATGDFIVRGIVPDSYSDPTKLEKAGIKAFRIKSASDNRQGLNPHLRARCE